MKFRFYALWLSAICILIFILQLLFEGFTDLFLLNSDAFVQPWRFLTPIFLHGGLTHLIFNMFALALFGSILEKLIGGPKFLLVFFLTGVLANLVSINFYDSALGASGAIFGVIGCLILIKPSQVVWAFGLPMPIFLAGILWVIADFIGVFMPSNVANFAHLSGMFFGLVFGALFRDWRKKENPQKVVLNERYVQDWEKYYLRK